MIGLLQRVSSAAVAVEGNSIAEIGPGLLVLVGIRRGDGPEDADRLASRLLAYRVFPDEEGRMNRSLLDTGGELLLVPQFTLAAVTDRGLRPGFEGAAPPAEAKVLFDRLVGAAQARLGRVQTGRFGAHMAVSLVNDGPVTFWLETRPSG